MRCVPEQLHLFPREGCRGHHGEAAIVTSMLCCVVLSKLGRFTSGHHFLKLAVSVTPLHRLAEWACA